jgi:hypothetical protein
MVKVRATLKQFGSEIYAAVESGKLRQPFDAAMLKQACPGWAPKTYLVFPAKHAVGNGKTTELFVRVSPRLYLIKK